MKLAVDLHSHSGYAGGVGQIELEAVSHTMKLKGINVFGTGDCLFPPRTKELKQQLIEKENGLFSLRNDTSRFLLQTEVIFSTKLKHKKNKTVAHHIVLFPNFESISSMQKLMQKWEMKNTIGRPFIISNSQTELEEQLFQIAAIHPLIDIIPAHVMTPDGILGSKNDLVEMREFYGDFLANIHCIETGLSADPAMLGRIPDLHKLTFISNSDCHSAALNRIGREFTVIDVENISYESIILAIRKNKVDFTAEFNPAEGRYFLTGHRANRKGHRQEIIFSEKIPEDLICPVCKSRMNLGVHARCRQLQDHKLQPLKRSFKHLIPLVEVIANSLQVKSVATRKVMQEFKEIMKLFPSEIALWQSNDIQVLLDKRISQKTINRIMAVQRGDFAFDPPGFDGNYGVLKIADKFEK